MIIELDIAKIREKVLQMIAPEHEEAFKDYFDNAGYIDLIENTEDFVAEGVLSDYINNVL